MNDSLIRKITDGKDMQFPCWVFSVMPHGSWWWRCMDFEVFEYDRITDGNTTHWHPNSDNPPTDTPAIHVLSQQLREEPKEKSDIVFAAVTPRTDVREHTVKGPNAWSIHDFGAVPADFARALEREVQELAEWKRQQLAVMAWWSEVDTFVRNDPEMKIGDTVSGKALQFLQERKRLKALVSRLASQWEFQSDEWKRLAAEHERDAEISDGRGARERSSVFALCAFQLKKESTEQP